MPTPILISSPVHLAYNGNDGTSIFHEPSHERSSLGVIDTLPVESSKLFSLTLLSTALRLTP